MSPCKQCSKMEQASMICFRRIGGREGERNLHHCYRKINLSMSVDAKMIKKIIMFSSLHKQNNINCLVNSLLQLYISFTLYTGSQWGHNSRDSRRTTLTLSRFYTGHPVPIEQTPKQKQGLHQGALFCYIHYKDLHHLLNQTNLIQH